MAETVELNVGGVRHEVARSTLLHHPDFMLAVLVSERWDKSSGNGSDKREPIFIDRDGERFRFVLDFYRNCRAVVPTSAFAAVEAEFDFFGLPKTAITRDRIERGEAVKELATLKRKYAYLGLLTYAIETAITTGTKQLRLNRDDIKREFKLDLLIFDKEEFVSFAKEESVAVAISMTLDGRWTYLISFP